MLVPAAGSAGKADVFRRWWRPHVAADSDGLLVNLGANNDVTVSGTVTVDASGAAVPITDNSGSLTVDNGGTFAVQVDGDALTSLQLIDDAVATDGSAAGTKLFQVGGTDGTNAQIVSTNSSGHVNIADGGNAITVDGTVTANLAAGTNNIGDVDVLTLPSLPAGTNAIGKLAANSGVDIGDVDVTSVSGTVTTKETKASTGTTSQVADNSSSTTVLASNANRLGASILNDSSARLYLKAGATASTTDYTVSLAQNDYWEVPSGYTGKIDGIWASDPGDGAARVTEYTA